MSDYKEFTGKNIDEAIEEACKKFKASREKLEIEIISGGSTGIFGLVGVKKAAVRARLRQSEAANGRIAEAPKDVKPQPKPKDQLQAKPQEQPKAKAPEQPQAKAPEQPLAKASEQPQAKAPEQPLAKPQEQPKAKAAPQQEPEPRPKDNEDEKSRQAKGRSRRKPKQRPAQPGESAEQAAPQADEQKAQNGKPGGRRRGGRRKPRKDPEAAANGNAKPGNEKNRPQNNGRPKPQDKPENRQPEKPVDDTEAFAAKDMVLDVVGKLIEPIVSGVKLTAEVEPGRVKIIIEDEENAGLIIGADGQTIASLQYLANRIVARQAKGNVRVHLDAGDYRERQDDSLRQLAWSLADKAKNQGRTQATRPLSSYHRRVVHMALQEDEGIQTLSKGDGPMKRVLILPRPRNDQ